MGNRARGECPKCGMPVPLLKTQWGLGRPFSCKACGTPLVIPKAGAAAAVSLYVVAWIASQWLGLAVVVIVLLAGLLFKWRFADVSRASTDWR